ncbi:MAG: CvpA family protein [Persicimonas sp.]
MTLDAVAIFVLIVSAILGWRSGAIRQTGRIAAAVLAVLCAPLGAPMVRRAVFSESDWSAPAIEASALLLSGVLIYVAVALLAWMLVRAVWAVSETLSHLDRFGGGLVGLLKGALIVYFLLTVFVLVKVPAERVDPSNALKLRGGAALTFVEEHNVLAPWQLPTLSDLHEALRVRYYARHFEREHIVRDHAVAADVLRSEVVADLADDEALMQAVLEDHYPITLADPRVREVLDDERLSDRIASVDWSSLLEEVRSPK